MPSSIRQHAIAVVESDPLELEFARTSIPARTPTGLVFVDSTMRITSCNSVALEIFGYPDMTHAKERLNSFILKTFGSAVRQRVSVELSAVTELFSGRRQYSCRAYLLDQCKPDEHIAIVLKRSSSIWSGLTDVCKQFALTPRESQVLRLISRGLATKEIASEMNLSPNTVKAFIRMMVIKMGVSSRARLVFNTLNCLEAIHAQAQPADLDFIQAHRTWTAPRAPASAEKPQRSPQAIPNLLVMSAPSVRKSSGDGHPGSLATASLSSPRQ